MKSPYPNSQLIQHIKKSTYPFFRCFLCFLNKLFFNTVYMTWHTTCSKRIVHVAKSCAQDHNPSWFPLTSTNACDKKWYILSADASDPTQWMRATCTSNKWTVEIEEDSICACILIALDFPCVVGGYRNLMILPICAQYIDLCEHTSIWNKIRSGIYPYA